MLGDGSLKLLYAFEGQRRAKRLRGASPATIETLAARCNVYEPSKEREAPHYVKERGRQRLVANYGPEKRMRQLMVADLLRTIHPPLEQQYLFRGGMPAAFRAVETAYHEGFTFGMEIDLVDFYGSVRSSGLADLLRPLPHSVVESVVWDRVVGSDMDDVNTTMSSMPWSGSSSPARQVSRWVRPAHR